MYYKKRKRGKRKTICKGLFQKAWKIKSKKNSDRKQMWFVCLFLTAQSQV